MLLLFCGVILREEDEFILPRLMVRARSVTCSG